MTKFSVEIERDFRWGPFAYSLFISPEPRFGDQIRFAWTLNHARRKARRWIAAAERMGPKTGRDREVIERVDGAP